MTQRAERVSSYYEEMPFSLVLFRYMWPFWLFKDATRGDRLARAAAYRHNRSMRMYLPGYMLRWMFGSMLAFGFVSAADALSEHRAGTTLDMFTVLAGAGAIALVCSLCVLLLIGYVYLYLNRHDA